VPILIFWWDAVVQMSRAKAIDARRSRYSLLSF
jgi:hypothetical protein